MRRFKKPLIGLVLLFAVFSLLVFFALPPILKSILTKKLSEALQREVTIEKIQVNPYILSLTGQGLKVKERGSSEIFAAGEEIYLNLQALSALRWELILKEIRVRQPFLNLVRNVDGSYNFSDLLEKKPSQSEEKGTAFHFSLNNIQVQDGRIDFWDKIPEKKHTVRELNLSIPSISNTPRRVGIFIQPFLSAKVNGTPYELRGKTKPFADSLETAFDIQFEDLDLPFYLAYVPFKMNFRVPSAYLDAKAKITFLRSKDKVPSLTVQGDLALKKLAIDDREGKPVFRLPRFDVSVASAQPFARTVHLAKIAIQSPELEIRRNRDGLFNFESLLPEKEETKKETKAKEDSTPFTLEIDEIGLSGGKVSFSDLSLKEPFKTILSPVEMKVLHFSNSKDKKTDYAASLVTEAKETVKVEGSLSIDPLQGEGALELKNLPFRKYSPYYRDRIHFDVADGALDLGTRYQHARGEKEMELSLKELSLSLRSLRLKRKEEKEDFFRVPLLTVQDTGFDLSRKEVKVGRVSTEKGMLAVTRLKDGNIDLMDLFPPLPKGKEEKTPPKDEKPWTFKAGKIAVDKFQITLEDRFPPEPATLSIQDLAFKAENFGTVPGQKASASLAFRLKESGNVAIDGSVGMNPPGADLKVALKGIALKALQPYFSDRVKIEVTDGNLSTTGTLALSSREGAGWQVSYKGDGSVNNFASIDKSKAEDFLKWESFSISGMDVGYNPLYVHIAGIALSNFYSRLIIHPDGSLNVQNILGKTEPQEQAPPSSSPQTEPSRDKPPSATPDSPLPDIKIAKVTLQGGEINFSDDYIKPHYSANLTEVGGRISDLNAAEMQSGDVELRGMWNKTEPIEITGKVNPVAQDLFVDLTVRLRDIELSPLTPYASKYLGYTIEKGKLAMDLKYLIVKKKLDAENKIFFDQLTLGDRVESPEATKLPVKFGISLLKDRKGEIRLDVPVTGRLDDPKFSVFRIVLQVIGNLLVKAATSPFALISALTGGGEQLEFAEFEYGSAEVKDGIVKKLNTIAKALQDRPGIKLDVEGHVDTEKDREALKTLFFQRKIKTQKVKETVKKGQPSVPVDEIKIEPKEYEPYLRKAYKEERFPKPKNFLGLEKEIPVPEMEKLMLTHLQVQEGELRDLARQRAMKVKDFLVREGKIEPERIFLVEAKSLPPEKKENLKDSRVVFAFK